MPQMHLLAGVADAVTDYVLAHPISGITGAFLIWNAAQYWLSGKQVVKDVAAIKRDMLTAETLENTMLRWEDKLDQKYVTKEQIEAMMVEKSNGKLKARAQHGGD